MGRWLPTSSCFFFMVNVGKYHTLSVLEMWTKRHSRVIFFVFRPETRVCFFKIPFSEGWYIQNIAICSKNTAWLNSLTEISDHIRYYWVATQKHEDWWPKNYGSCSTSSLYWINQRITWEIGEFKSCFHLKIVCSNLSFLELRRDFTGFRMWICDVNC